MRQFRRQFISYHYPCPDGIFAALAARQHFKQAGISALHFLPNKVFAPLSLEDIPLTADDALYMLDYVGPEGFAVEASRHAGRVILLDHHLTAIEAFEELGDKPANLEVNLDLELSGATIALNYFNPKINERQRSLFNYIEDADLWRWRLQDSKFFYAGFAALGLELDANKNSGIFDELLALDPADVIAKGRVAQAEIDEKIAKGIRCAAVVQLGGSIGEERGFGQCLAIQAEEDSGLDKIRSQLGNELAGVARDRGFRAIGLIAYREREMADGKVKCSLRSLGEEDTTVISKAFGGGGHLNASSFILDADDFQSWLVEAKDAH